MRLPDEVFEEVCMTLGVGPPDADDLYRRRAVRFPAEAEVAIHPAGVAAVRPRTVMLVNISSHGVCLVDSVTSQNGQQFVLELPRVGGNTFSLLCTVKQSRLTSHGQYRVGAEFSSEYKAGAQARLLSGAAGVMSPTVSRDVPLAAASESEGGWDAEVGMVGGTPGMAIAATVCERSRAALGLIIYKSIAVGDRFVVRFVPPGGQPIKCMCMATRVHMLDHGKYRVSARVEGIAVQPQRTGLIGWVLKTFCCLLLWLGSPLSDATSPEALGSLSQALELPPHGDTGSRPSIWWTRGVNAGASSSVCSSTSQPLPGSGTGWA